MLGKTILTAMADYNAATNARLLTLTANLTDAQVDAPTEYGSSLRETLAHMIVLEWVNRTFTQTHAYPTTPPPLGQSPTVAELQSFAGEEAERLRAFIAERSEDDLTAPVAVPMGGDATLHIAPWQGIVQLLTHSMQHRSEIAAMLTHYGQSPGDIDFIFHLHPQMHP